MGISRIYTREELTAMDHAALVELALRLQEHLGAEEMKYTSLSQRMEAMSDDLEKEKKEKAEAVRAKKEAEEKLKNITAILNEKQAKLRVHRSEKFGRSNEGMDVVASLLGVADETFEAILAIAGQKAKEKLEDGLQKLQTRLGREDSGDGTEDGGSPRDGDEDEDGREKDNVGQGGQPQPAAPPADGGECDPAGQEAPATQQKHADGNPNLHRPAGFMELYFRSDVPTVFVIDDFYYTAEEVRDLLGLKDISDLAYICSEISVYECARLIPATVLKELHIVLKLKRNKEGMNKTLENKHFGKLIHGGSIASQSLISHIICEKYVKGVSYYRIESELKSMGLNLKRATFIDEVIKASELLDILPRFLLRKLKKFNVIQADETYDTVSMDERGPGHNCYYWMFRSSEKDTSMPPVALFIFDQSRAALIPQFYLHGYTGKVVSDGYRCYRTLKDRNGSIIHCVCWVHGRRFILKMFRGSGAEFREKLIQNSSLMNMETLDINKLENLPESEKVSMWGLLALLIIAELYKIEKTLGDLSPEERLKKRREKMTGLVGQFFEMIALVEAREEARINDYARQAVSYFTNNRDALRQFLEDGNVTLDNSACERLAVHLAIGRNSWKAHDSFDGARATALFYTLTELARLNNADPKIYLEYLLASIRDIRYRYAGQIAESDMFEEKKKERLEAARKRLAENPRLDPMLDMNGLGEGPDLSFLECLMPWSAEFRAYAEKWNKEIARYLADAMTRSAFEHMCISPDKLKDILGREKGDDKRHPVKKQLKEAMDRTRPDLSQVEENLKQQTDPPVKGLILPTCHRPESFISPDNTALKGDPPLETEEAGLSATDIPMGEASDAEEETADIRQAEKSQQQSRRATGGTLPSRDEEDGGNTAEHAQAPVEKSPSKPVRPAGGGSLPSPAPKGGSKAGLPSDGPRNMPVPEAGGAGSFPAVGSGPAGHTCQAKRRRGRTLKSQGISMPVQKA